MADRVAWGKMAITATRRGQDCFLDLEKGKLFDGPDAEQVKQPPPSREVAEMKAWAAHKGIDLLGEGGALCGLELVLLPAKNRSWDAIPRGTLVSLLKQAEPATPALLLPAEKLPAILYFRTREGALGVLQVVAFVEHKVGGRGVSPMTRFDAPSKTANATSTAPPVKAPIACEHAPSHNSIRSPLWTCRSSI